MPRGMSDYDDPISDDPPMSVDRDMVIRLEARVSELEANIASIHASTRRMSFAHEWYIEGVRTPPGDYVLMRVGPATPTEVPF